MDFYNSLKSPDNLALGQIESVRTATVIDIAKAKEQTFSQLAQSRPQIFSRKEDQDSAMRMTIGLSKRRAS